MIKKVQSTFPPAKWEMLPSSDTEHHEDYVHGSYFALYRC